MRSAQFAIDPFVLYALAVAVCDRSEEAFEPYIMTSFLSRHFHGFFQEAEEFGKPGFEKERADRFIETRKRKQKEVAGIAVQLIRELRYAMDRLAMDPIMVDTGRYRPKYEKRQYLDMENEIARDLVRAHRQPLNRTDK
jgi:hypothetical protein